MKRHQPDRPFPPYAFVPGLHPHPNRDPKGHSYGHEEVEPQYIPSAAWRENEEYLYGVDLYNHGFFWESHEAWEGLWLKCESVDETQRQFLQALIQLSAATLKIAMKQPTGLEKLAKIGSERLLTIAKDIDGRYMGLDLTAHAKAFKEFAATAPESADQCPKIELK